MAEYKDWSLDRLEGEYREALAEYEGALAKRARLLDLRRARDAKLEALSPDDRDAWERAHATVSEE